ncbi:MAG: branched-chain amino acid ABC transporter permease [Actinomycetota bacterium]|nr:branched-chain amino acid ABC transporter permease [Actinomycetota bacterium]
MQATQRPTGWMRHLVALTVAALAGLACLSVAPAARAAGEAVAGFVRVDGTPAAGVSVTVKKKDGGEAGTGKTGPDGRFKVSLPGPGTYTVSPDTSSFPAGAKLLNAKRGSLVVNVGTGDTRFVIFPLTKGKQTGTGGGGNGKGQHNIRALQLLLEGIRFGLIIAITAVGLSLIYGTTGLTNFAHGELVTFGAIVAWALNVHAGLQLIPATIIAILIGGLAGGLNERLLWRPLRRRGTGLIAMLVISIGLSILARYVMLVLYSDRSHSYNDYGNQTAHDYGPVNLTDKDLASIGLSLLVLVGVALLLQRSRIGKAMRAVADNRDLASSSGINVDRVVLVVWIMGGGLAALGGVLYGLSDQVSWEMGFRLLLLMFAGITLGGLGTAYGALLGSVLVGILVQMSTLVVAPELKNVGGLLILIIILIVRPSGLLGARTRIG